MNTTALGDRQGEVSFPDGTKIFFDCDKTVVEKLTQACRALPDTKVEQGIIASGDIFVSDRKKRKRIADTFGALVCEMEGAAIGYVCYALKLLTESSGQSPMTLTKTRVLTMKNSANLQAKKP